MDEEDEYTIDGLCNAAMDGKLSDVQQHLQKGVDVNRKYVGGNTPLHLAAFSNEYNVCLVLLQHGSRVEMKNEDNKTPLDIAKTHGHHKVVQLLESYAQKYTTDGLCVAARDGRLSGVKKHLQNGADVNKKNSRRKLVVDSLQKSLTKAKNQHGKLPVRFIKILLTGSGASGKTSFSNLLTKKQFNRLHHSTILVHSKHVLSIKKAVIVESNHSTSNQDIVWLKMDDSSQISHLGQVLLQPKIPSQKYHSKPRQIKSNEAAVIVDTTTDCNIRQKYTMTKSPQLSITKRFTNLLQHQSSVKSEKLTSFAALVESAHDITQATTTLTHHPGEVLNIITILDTGGQPEYIHLLPTVNIHPMITFIVHDLSKNLEDQVLVEYRERGKHFGEPYLLDYSNLDMIKFLMSSINDSLERPLSKVPQLVTAPGKDSTSYLCCVGTHADKVTPENIHKVNSQLTNLVQKLDCKAATWQNREGGVLFAVDNTTAGNDTEDPNATFIRHKVESLSSDKDVYELPITWMLLELEIRQVCTKREKAYISFQECASIASQSKLITDVEQVRSALLYHHLLGVLLYYPEVPGLCEYIIIDHQWLFDKLSQIVCFTLKKPSSNVKAVTKLKCSGILSRALVRELKWNDELKKEYFISLLIVMNIIAPVPREDGDGEDYFIPYILPTYSSQPTGDAILSQYGCLQGEPLLFQFVSNLLPRGFFCCLIVKILQHLPSGWRHLITYNNVCHTYSNLITFCMPHAYFLSLADRLSYLEVQIRHEQKHYYIKCPIHLTVKDFLTNALENVCEQLYFNKDRLKYGFHCQCGESDDEHIAILTTVSPPFDYAQCGHSTATPTKLQYFHLVWFTEKVDEMASKATEIHNDNELPEYKVFTDYYSKLVNTIPACSLSHYFVSENVISLTNHEEITKPTTPSHRAAQLLLNKVLYMLKEQKNVDCFNKMLSIMEHHGDCATRTLSQEIKLKLDSGQLDTELPHSATLEAAPPLNIVPDQLIIEDCQSPEYLVIIKNYSKLVDTLTVKTLSCYFVSHKIISTKEEEEITKPTTSSVRAAVLLLSRVINPLKARLTINFYIFLNIIDLYGNEDIRHLSTTIRKEVYEMKTDSVMKGSGDKSKVRITLV